MSGWKDAYDSQMETWRWVRSTSGKQWRAMSLRHNAEGLSASTRSLITGLYAIEEEKLLAADPFFVSREMCEVADAASETFSPEPLLETDFLTRAGFVHFEKPFVMPDKYEVMVQLGGFSWAPLVAQTQDDIVEIDAAWKDTLEPTMRTVDAFERESESMIALRPELARKYRIPRNGDVAPLTASGMIGVALTLYAVAKHEAWPTVLGQPPSLVPMHHTPWWYGMELDGNEFDEVGARTGVERWWQVIQTTLRLMQQRLASRASGLPDRSSRRRAKRYGFPDEREVVIVKLRREKSQAHGEPMGEANYSHRFIRSGHWRNQWFPSAQLHRQIWIHPTVVGDPKLPLVVRPKRVFALTR